MCELLQISSSHEPEWQHAFLLNDQLVGIRTVRTGKFHYSRKRTATLCCQGQTITDIWYQSYHKHNHRKNMYLKDLTKNHGLAETDGTHSCRQDMHVSSDYWILALAFFV